MCVRQFLRLFVRLPMYFHVRRYLLLSLCFCCVFVYASCFSVGISIYEGVVTCFCIGLFFCQRFFCARPYMHFVDVSGKASLSVSVCAYHFAYVYAPVCASVYASVYVSVCVSVRISIYVAVYVTLSIFVCICASLCDLMCVIF